MAKPSKNDPNKLSSSKLRIDFLSCYDRDKIYDEFLYKLKLADMATTQYKIMKKYLSIKKSIIPDVIMVDLHSMRRDRDLITLMIHNKRDRLAFSLIDFTNNQEALNEIKDSEILFEYKIDINIIKSTTLIV